MPRYRGRADQYHGDHGVAWLVRTKAAFVEIRGDGEVASRQAAIDVLPRVLWRGRTLYTLRCHGDFGRGPHDMHVPEALLWALIGFDCYRCVYHR